MIPLYYFQFRLANSTIPYKVINSQRVNNIILKKHYSLEMCIPIIGILIFINYRIGKSGKLFNVAHMYYVYIIQDLIEIQNDPTNEIIFILISVFKYIFYTLALKYNIKRFIFIIFNTKYF